MNLYLNRFEQQINDIILERGYDYFEEGCVTEVKDLGHGDYEATVEGSDTYTVRLHLEGSQVTDYECDCPYDKGPVCKHVVAVLYYLQQYLSGKAGDCDPLMDVEKNSPRQEPEALQAERLLERLTHEELKAFVGEAIANDRKLRERFVRQHITTLYPASKEVYVQQIDALTDICYDRYGFISYDDTYKLQHQVAPMAQEALTDVEEGRYRSALYKAEAIAEGIFETFETADDSGGYVGRCIDSAFEVLDALAGEDLDAGLHDEMFDWLLTRFEKNTMKGWEWHFGLISTAIKMMAGDKEKKRIRTALEKIQPDGTDWDWNYKQAEEQMAEFVRKTEGEKAARDFMEAHLSNSAFRKQLIETALREKDFAKARRLVLEGIEKDEQEHPGLAEDWRHYLLDISQQTGDMEQAISLARHFFLLRIECRFPQRYYYDLLKTLVPQERWAEETNSLVTALCPNGNSGERYSDIANIYIWEERWDDLLGLLRQHPSLYHVEQAEEYLKDQHAEELAAMYRDDILAFLEHNLGRGHYQTACSYIRRMIRLGAQGMATELIATLKATYRKRRALLEELDNI